MDEELKSQVGRALGQVPSGCFIMTARHDGRATGMLASWVQQASFEPPTVSVAVKSGRPIQSLIDASGHFLLNAVGEEPAAMFKHFGKGFGPEDDAFSGLTTRDTPAGVVIESCLSHLACKVVGQADAGDHAVYLGQIIGGAVHRAGKPYVHIRSNGFKY